ncbi:bzip transcription factor [Phytophthora cinnamomi]|uniref:bzip transcription factor n=1 Tax=Phytophthora cinnamomi TaxID=4785 RepID=UPI003559B7E2|nr:bzip transcription factor [Phytophthora cinnamomi]
MHSPGRFRAASRAAPHAPSRHLPRWDAGADADADADEDAGDAFLSASDLVKTLQPVPRRAGQSRRPLMAGREPPPQAAQAPRRWPPPLETQTPLGLSDWPFDGSPSPAHEDAPAFRARTPKAGAMRGSRAFPAADAPLELDVLQDAADDYEAARARAFQLGYDPEPPRHSQAQLQRYHQQRQYQRAMQREFGDPAQMYRRASSHPEHALYARDARGREPVDDLPFDPPRRIPRSTQPHGASTSTSAPLEAFGLHAGGGGGLREPHASRAAQSRRFNAAAAHSPGFVGSRMDELPLEPAMLDMYPDDVDTPPTSAAQMSRRREYAQLPPQQRQRIHQQMPRRPQSADRITDNDVVMAGRRPFHDADLPRDRRGPESRAVYEELVPTPTGSSIAQNNDYANLSPNGRGSSASGAVSALPASSSAHLSRPRPSLPVERLQKAKRPRPDETTTPPAGAVIPTEAPGATAKPTKGRAKKSDGDAAAVASPSEGKDSDSQPKRRCGRKSMNYSSEQKRERNRAAVKKCRQRQALKLEYLQHKAESLAAENQALSEMLVKNTELDEEQRSSLTRGIQMDILLKIKEIFTQSLPKDFVLDADSIWDLNSVLAVSMPSRCYYGIESIKDFWRTSLRMRNKGKIRSFWAWLFRLPPGDRFSEFDIQPFSPTSNLYFISWTTKSTPPLAGSMVIMFGNGHRVTLHVECFGWLIWRYLLTNEPFPEPPME